MNVRAAAVAAVLAASWLPAEAAGDAAEIEALSAEGIAGEILDTAIRHCRRGETAPAFSMFEAIRTQLQPPPAILRLVDDLQASGCRPTQGNAGVFRIQVGSGWDSNVSQGISARSLVLGSGAGAIELELDEGYRPRSSAFVQAAADYTAGLGESGVSLQLGLGHRNNLQQGDFNLTTASATLARDFSVGGAALRAQVDLAEIWLAGRHYQGTRGASLQFARPDGRGGWLATAEANRVHYVTEPAQDAWQFELGLTREHRFSASATVYAGLFLHHDDATRARAGGDRSGYRVQAGGAFALSGWYLRPLLSYTRWDSKELFAPGLLDVHRRNRLVQAVLQAEKPLTMQSSLLLELRSRRARDSVALYSYTAHVLSATFSRKF